MSRVRFLFAISVLALVTLLIEAISGFVLWLVLPRGGGGGGEGRGLGGGQEAIASIFIWDRHTWLDIHDWTAVAFLVLLAVHIYVHWRWLYRQTKSLFGG